MTRVLVVGGGFGGFHAARELERRLHPSEAEVVVVSTTNHLLYTPLLPEVAGGILDPRDVTVPLSAGLRSRLALGRVVDLGVHRRVATLIGPEGDVTEVAWDRLVLAAGSVSRIPPIPGLAEHAIGFRSTAEAAHLRDHVLQQLDLAAGTVDFALHRARSTFVVVGAGFAGTELVGFLQRLAAEHRRRNAHGSRSLAPRWVLLDAGHQVLPELGARLGDHAAEVLRRRGVDVRPSTSVEQVTADGVRTHDGRWIPTRTVIWCGGVEAHPLARSLGVPLDRGRVPVDDRLAVVGRPDVFAIGDLAAVPDVTRPGEQTPPTAQHAMRQGVVAGRNVAASLGRGSAQVYRHRDLGAAADLGGWQGAARPLGVPVTGLLARAAARGYHLTAIPGNRTRIAAAWLSRAGRPPSVAHLDHLGQPEPTLEALAPAT